MVRRITLFVAILVVAGCGQVNRLTGIVEKTNPLNDPLTTAQALKRHHLDSLMVVQLFQKPMSFHWAVARQLFMLDGYTSIQSDSLVVAWQAERDQSFEPTSAVAITGACEQAVEYKTVVRDAVFSYGISSFNSSRGTEYLYYFNPWWTVDPNNIRWAATDPRVQWAIWIRTSFSGVAGHSLCSKPFTLQLGDNTVGAAGGPYWVMANFYVHHL